MAKLNEIQNLAAYGKFDKDVLVSAGAGSGKTQVLTTRVTNIISNKIKPTELLVLTFTNAAAAEMKSRVRSMLYKDPSLSEYIPLLEQAYITTFDSFNLSICKKYYYALNVSPNISVADSSSMLNKKKEILSSIIDELFTENDAILAQYLEYFSKKNDNEFISDLLAIIDCIDKKSDSIMYLNNYENNYFSDEFKNIIISDYNKYLNEYYKKAVLLLLNVKDRYDKVENRDKVQSIIDIYSKGEYNQVRQILGAELPRKTKNDSDDLSDAKEKYSKFLTKLKEIMRFESIEKAIQAYDDSKKYIMLFVKILKKYYVSIYAYEQEFGLYEFNDIQKLAIKLVSENESIREEIKNSFYEILVDEYQDTSDLQEEFLSLIKNDNMFMVGDIKQSIYRFRNANPMIFKQKYISFYSLDPTKYQTDKLISVDNVDGYLVDMNQNYRSRREVLDDINMIFDKLMTLEVGDADYKASHEMKFGLALYDSEPCSDARGFSADYITYSCDKDNIGPAEYYEGYIIANDILSKVGKYKVFDKDAGLFRPAKHSDFAIILDRSNNFGTIKKVLEYYKIPVVIIADESITESSVSKVLVNILMLIAKSYDRSFDNDYYHALASVLRSFVFEYDDKQIYDIVTKKSFDNRASELAFECAKNIDKMTQSLIYQEALLAFNVYTKLSVVGDADKALHEAEFISQKLEDLSNMGYHFTESVTFLSDMFNDNSAKYKLDTSTSQGVKIMNIHKSKGLEYPICYFGDFTHNYNSSNIKGSVGFSNRYGIFTPYYDEGADDTIIKELNSDIWTKETTSERIRLFYVALTRAREKMIFLKDVSKQKEATSTDEQKSFSQYFDYLGDIFKNKIELDDAYFASLNPAQFSSGTKDLGLDENNTGIKYDVPNVENELISSGHISKTMKKVLNKEQKDKLDIGTHYHEILEMIDFNDVDGSIKELGLSESDVKKINELLKTDALINISKAKSLHEHEFSCIIDNVAYNGIIDLLCVYDDHIEIVDYKLKNIDDEAYDRQLNLYAKYVRTKTNLPIKAYLLSIMDAITREVKLEV